MHYQHHAKPNVIDKDPDTRIDTLFLLGNTIPIRVGCSFVFLSCAMLSNHRTTFAPNRKRKLTPSMERKYRIISSIYTSSSVRANDTRATSSPNDEFQSRRSCFLSTFKL